MRLVEINAQIARQQEAEERRKAHNAKYPEHVKLKAHLEESRSIQRFLEFATEKGHMLTPDGAESWIRTSDREIEKLLAEHFGIDLEVVEAEKLAMLDEIRKSNEGTE